MQVAETLVKRHTLVGEILAVMVLPQLLLIGRAGGLIWYGVGRGLGPLERLRTDILRRSHRDLSPLEVSCVPAEAAPLVNALNDLFDRLDRAVVSQNRFIANAAHQLRTPLAGLKTQVELAMHGDDPGATRAPQLIAACTWSINYSRSRGRNIRMSSPYRLFRWTYAS